MTQQADEDPIKVADSGRTQSQTALVRNATRLDANDLDPLMGATKAEFDEVMADSDTEIDRWSETERKARSEVAESVARHLGIESQLHVLEDAWSNRYPEPPLKAKRRPDFIRQPPAAPVADVGVLWWAQSMYWLPALPESSVGLTWDSVAGGYQITGQIQRDNGHLWIGRIRILAQFGLGVDRMPPAGRYQSRPIGELYGTILADTGQSDISLFLPFAGSDQWTKAVFYREQTVRQDNQVLAHDENAQQTFFFIEEAMTTRIWSMNGPFAFPPLAFDLDPHTGLEIDLVLGFDFQLEGQSLVRFGDWGGFRPMLYRTPQWKLLAG